MYNTYRGVGKANDSYNENLGESSGVVGKQLGLMPGKSTMFKRSRFWTPFEYNSVICKLTVTFNSF